MDTRLQLALGIETIVGMVLVCQHHILHSVEERISNIGTYQKVQPWIIPSRYSMYKYVNHGSLENSPSVFQLKRICK